MRILHTADWHLGKKLNERMDLKEVHEDLLNQIKDIIKKEKIDVFVLAGDIFQNFNVSDDAIELLNDFLTEMVSNNPDKYFILINGNHDPVERLNFGSDLMLKNLKIISKIKNIHSSILPITIEKENIVYDFYPIPFYRVNEYKSEVLKDLSNEFIQETKDIYKDILKKININKKNKNIFITHTAIDFMNTQYRTDSEDDSYGTVGLVPAEIFNDFDLVLLGHYHKNQKFKNNFFYSGSIYKYSAKEYNHTKGIYIHDLQSQKSEFISLVPNKNVHYIEGSFLDIINRIYKNFEKNQLENDYFYVELHDKNLINNVKSELSKYFTNIVEIWYKDSQVFSSDGKINITQNDLRELNRVELFEKFLEFVYSMDDKLQEKDISQIILQETQYSKEILVKTFKELWYEYQKNID